MPRIFISYRRSDSRKDAGRLYDRLVHAFGRHNIFKDVDNIPPGTDFRGALTEAVSSCDVLLVIIGQQWIDARDEQGNRRLDDPDDYVRIEIETGLARSRAVTIPVLVDGASVPKPEELPSTLRELSFKNAVVVRDDPDFHRDVARLVDWLSGDYLNNAYRPSESQRFSSAERQHLPTVTEQTQQRPVRQTAAIPTGSRLILVTIAGVLALFAVIMALWWVNRINGGGGNLPAVTENPAAPGIGAAAASTVTDSVVNDATLTHTSTQLPTATLSRTPTSTVTPSRTPTYTPSLSLTQIEQTVQVEMSILQMEIAETATAQDQATHQAETATATWWTPTPTINARATAEARLTELAVIQAASATADAQATAKQAVIRLTETATLWTPTPTPTSTPTITPSKTNTPDPTATPTVTPSVTPSQTSSPTRTPTRRPTATLVPRASATTRPTATPRAVRLGAAGGDRIVRPVRSGTVNPNFGAITHNGSNSSQVVNSQISARDFVTEVTFHNPYMATEDREWDMGIYFRWITGQGMRLAVHSSGYWLLQSWENSPAEDIQEGYLNNLNTQANGSNKLKLVTVGNYGAFFLNDVHITNLDLSTNMSAGSVAVTIGIFSDSKVSGSTTRYSGWSLVAPEPLNAPQQGELRHDGDGRIEVFEIRGAQNAAIKRRDFIVEVTFDTPFATTDSDSWDFGLLIRHVGVNQQLRLTFVSNGRWRLANYAGTAERDGNWIVDSRTTALNITPNSENDLVFIAAGEHGILFLNDTFLGVTNLSKRMDSGNIMIGTEFYNDTGRSGSATGYSNFRVWALGSG